MGRHHWPHYAGQTFTLRATDEQAADWINAARTAGFKHTSKWIAEAADFYATYQKKQVEKVRKAWDREQKRVDERMRRVAAGLDPDTGEPKS